jgi:outer membrane receptor protein involved in Fe transport
MRFTTFQLLLIAVTFSVASANDSKAQEILSRQISVKFNEVSLKKAITVIERKANIHFTYSAKKIEVNQKVSLFAKKESLELICKKLFEPLKINFKVYKNSDILLTNNLKLDDLSGYHIPENFLIPIRGVVKSKNNEPLIGASIAIQGTTAGTTTDLDGNFFLEVEELPVILAISYTGYEDVIVEVNSNNANNLNIELTENSVTLDQVVVGASRHSERFVEAPVTVEKIDGATVLTSGSESVMESLTNLKGVQMMKGSLSGPVINTRGFADMNNLRFLMHLDGMDVTSPGFGVYANVGGVSNLDLQSIEIIPGSSSALYGANAFNGILLAKSKDAFIHQGISFQFKQGLTVQEGYDNNSYTNIAFRHAVALTDKLAFKVDYEGLFTKDWIADDMRRGDRTNNAAERPNDGANPPLEPAEGYTLFNAVNRYGDGETGFSNAFGDGEYTTSNGTPVTWTLGQVRRTGYNEEDLFDHKINNNRINASIHYKLTDDWRINALFKYGSQDLILRHTTSYPIKDFALTQYKLEIQGKGLTARTYTMKQTLGSAWTTILTVPAVQNALLPSAEWSQHFIDAYFGDPVAGGIASGNLKTAREYADSYMPAVDSDKFQGELLANTARTSSEGGSFLFDDSRYWHSDLIYDFTETMVEDPTWTLSLGASYRKLFLSSKGSLFVDNTLDNNRGYLEDPNSTIGYEGAVPISEGGIFGQVAKKLMDNRLSLSFIARANFHSQFDANFTPQASVVFSPDQNRNHNIRVSYTTGVRNPGAQEQYVHFVFTPTISILGGLQDLYDNYVIPNTTNTGQDFINGVNKWATDNNLDFQYKSLVPERNTTYEVGYKGLIGNKLLVDVNYYYSNFKNFVARGTLLAPGLGVGGATHVGLVYQNIKNDVQSAGFGIGLEYALGGLYKIYANYQNATFDGENATGQPSGLIYPAFNTPENRVNFGVSRSNRKGGFGFNIAARYISDWQFTSPQGRSIIPSVFTIDAGISYKFNDTWMLTFSGSNIGNADYFTITGGPNIGSVYTLGVLFDLKNNK